MRRVSSAWLLVVFGLVWAPTIAHAETLFFFAKATSVWNDAGNWFVPDLAHPGQFTLAGRIPNNSADDVEIGTACNAAGITFQPKANFTVEALATITGGNFDIFNLTFAVPKAGAGPNGFTGAVINIKASGSINFTIGNTFLTDCTIIFQGGAFVNQNVSVTVSGGTIFNQGSWVQHSGAVLTYVGGAARFDNIGDFRGGNGGTTQISGGSFLTFNNSGTLRADSGTLVIAGNLTWEQQDGSGVFFPATDDAIIQLNDILVVPVNTTTYFMGPGVVRSSGGVIVNGTLEVGVPASPQVNAEELVIIQTGRFDMTGNATVSGGGVTEVNDGSTFDVRGGTLIKNGSGQALLSIKVKKGGMLNLKGPNNNGKDFMSSGPGVCAIEGTMTVNLSELEATNFNIDNKSGGTINFQAPAGLVNNGFPVSTYTNSGTTNAPAGSGQNPLVGLGVVFDNKPDGTLNVTGSGAFNFYGGGTLAGNLYAPIGVPLNFRSGTFGLEPGVNFGNSKVVVLNNALFSLDATMAKIDDFELDTGGTLGGTGDLAIVLKFALLGGTINGGDPLSSGLHLTLEPSCSGSMPGFNPNTLNGGAILNYGTFTWSGAGSFNATNGATWTNFPNSIFDAQSDSNWNSDGTGIFNNQGLFKKTDGTGTTSMGLKFNNDGTVQSYLGTLAFCNFAQSSGLIELLGGVISTSCGMPLVIDGGGCDGSGSINGDVIIGTKVGPAIINPGHSPGKITINGNLTEGATAMLKIEVAGVATPGIDYDQIAVTGTARLGGALRVTSINGFTPTVADTIVPLTAGSITGKFGSVNAPVSYGATALAVGAQPIPLPQLLNISTRMRVLNGENVLIAGFIISGNDPKKVIIRGLGPSLGSAGVQGALPNPTLELHQGAVTLATNDDWKEHQAEVEATTIPPSNDLESAIVTTLSPGSYTAILGGKGSLTGIGLVEVYDLAQSADSQLVNISTRGFIDTGDNVMIGGVIAGPLNGGTSRVLIRGIGPSLQNAGVANPLQDPTMELRNGNGVLLASNDDWKTDQQSDIEGTTIPPTNDHESAILFSIGPGNFTAIVRGKNNSTGVGLVEVYNLH